MVDAKTIGIGLAGLAAAEATGITNFTGGGQRRPPGKRPAPGSGGNQTPIPFPVPSGGGGGGGPIIVPSGGGDGASGIGSGLAAILARQQQRSTEMAGRLTNLQTQNQDLATQIKNLRQRLGDGKDTVTDFTPNVPDPTGTGDGPGSGPGSTNFGKPASGFDIRRYVANPDKGVQTGDVIATGSTAVRGGEDVVTGTLDTLVKTGRTWAETTKALTGRKYSTKGTFAQQKEGGETRRLFEGPLIPQGPLWGGGETGRQKTGSRQAARTSAPTKWSEVSGSNKQLFSGANISRGESTDSGSARDGREKALKKRLNLTLN